MKQSKAPPFFPFIFFIIVNFIHVSAFLATPAPSLVKRAVGSSVHQHLRNSHDSNSQSDNFSVAIGEGSTLNLEGDGTLTFSESLLVDGTLIGNLKCLHDGTSTERNDDTLVKIGSKGELQADVKCVSNLEIYGILRGNVICKSVVIGSSAHVIGDIIADEVTIQPGGSMIGIIRTGNYAKEIERIQEETMAVAPLLAPEQETPTDAILSKPSAISVANSSIDEKKTNTAKVKPSNQNTILSANEYHKKIQNDAIRKRNESLASGMPKDGKGSSKDAEAIEWVDDFGNRIIDPNQGENVDSFGHPLIRGADDDQVASFREIRNLSKSTWTMIDSHRKEKERRRRSGNEVSMSTLEKDEDPPPLSDGGDEDAVNGDKSDKGKGDMPSFLRRKYF